MYLSSVGRIPAGGAGIARDIETISAIGLRTCLAVTAATVQTHEAVRAIHHLQPGLVSDQMRAALRANKVSAIKIGMLATAEIIAAVAAVLNENPRIPAVLDPVLASSSGRTLVEANAIGVLKRDLIPLCRLVTPNLIELAALVGSELAADDDAVLRQGRNLLAGGPQALLLKGGHATGPRSTDILLRSDREPICFDGPRLADRCAAPAACWPAPSPRIWRMRYRLKTVCAKARGLSSSSFSTIQPNDRSPPAELRLCRGLGRLQYGDRDLALRTRESGSGLLQLLSGALRRPHLDIVDQPRLAEPGGDE